MLLFQKGDHLFSFDLKSGYHHVDITAAQHKYLGFAWEFTCLQLCHPGFDTGFGGYVVEHEGCVSYGQWTAEGTNMSSTWRELSAVLCVLASVSVKLSSMRVQWFTDNQIVVRILQAGSKKANVQEVARQVFNLVVHSHIRLEPEQVPRELNKKADFLNHIEDWDDCCLTLPCLLS